MFLCMTRKKAKEKAQNHIFYAVMSTKYNKSTKEEPRRMKYNHILHIELVQP